MPSHDLPDGDAPPVDHRLAPRLSLESCPDAVVTIASAPNTVTDGSATRHASAVPSSNPPCHSHASQYAARKGDDSAKAAPQALDCRRPTLRACMVLHLPAAVTAAMVLCAAMAALFLPKGHAQSRGYCAAYVAISIALLFALFLAMVYRLRLLLKALGEELPKVMAVDPSDFHSILSDDALVAYLQHMVLQALTAPEPSKAGPLDFIQDDLPDWSKSSHGYVVIDTTGVILWVNSAVCAYFGYTADNLIQENVRILMPPTYAQQHDQFLRRHLRTGRRHIMGTTREVPVVDSVGSKSIVQLGVDDRVDPFDATSRLFIGRMTFKASDPLLDAMSDKIQMGICDVLDACKPLDASPHTMVTMAADGRILYMNRAGCDLLGWDLTDVLGKNINVLMPEPFASAHDGFLQRYQERAAAALKAGFTAPPSSIVGSGRDVMAKGKNDRTFRVFLMVSRMDRPSRFARDCIFVGKMVHIAESDTSSSITRSSADRSRLSLDPHGAGSEATGPSLRSNPKADLSVYKWHPLKAIRNTKCTILVLEVHGLHHTNPTAAHADYELFLGMVFGAATKHRGILQWIAGERAIVTFNVSGVANTSHRSSCAACMLQLTAMWSDCPLSLSSQLYMAAVSRDCHVAAWGQQVLLLGDAVDVCRAMLCAAIESHASHGLVDASLQEEIHFSYSCRPLNVLTVHPNTYRETVLQVYEVLCMKQSTDDQWMYEIETRDKTSDALADWHHCWDALLSTSSPGAGPVSVGLEKAAFEFLTLHLAAHPDDPQARWLEAVLQARLAGRRAPSIVDTVGLVPFTLHYRVPDSNAAGYPRAMARTAISVC